MQAATHTPQNLPDDLDGLRALVMTPMAERGSAISERDALAEQNERIPHLLFKRMQFGAKSERLPEEQLQVGLEALEQAVAHGDAEEKRDPEQRREGVAKRRASRGALPAHLPRTHVMVAPEDTDCPCCRTVMTVIGEDTSERLDVIPAQCRVLVAHRPKLICPSCAGSVVQMLAPPRLIEGSIQTEAMAVHVLVVRYADHLPLYCQAQIFAHCRGILQCAGYAAYKKLVAADKAGRKPDTPSVTLAFCWSCVRRDFYDEAKGGTAPIASEALQRLGALYEIDARVRGKSPAKRLARRQAESCPLAAGLRAWFETQVGRLPARSPTADAIRYTLNHWSGLERFLADGRIELDSGTRAARTGPVWRR